eukprot:2110566-Rhodomonas_salina.1
MGLRTQLMWIQRMERPGGSCNSSFVRKVLHGTALKKGLPTKSDLAPAQTSRRQLSEIPLLQLATFWNTPMPQGAYCRLSARISGWASDPGTA